MAESGTSVAFPGRGGGEAEGVSTMRKAAVGLLAAVLGLFGMAGMALADGPSGSTECAIQDDDCDTRVDEDTGTIADDNDGDGRIDEDTGTIADDNDGDGVFDEDPPGDVNGDGNPDDDGDGLVDEDPADDDGDGLVNEDVADDDGDGLVNEDPPGDAADDPGENQVACNAATSQDVNGVKVYVGENGVEACSDGSATAPEGRFIATTDDGGYVAGDGDATNGAPANGYARVDESGVHCGDTTNQDSTATDQSANTPEDCNAGG